MEVNLHPFNWERMGSQGISENFSSEVPELARQRILCASFVLRQRGSKKFKAPRINCVCQTCRPHGDLLHIGAGCFMRREHAMTCWPVSTVPPSGLSSPPPRAASASATAWALARASASKSSAMVQAGDLVSQTLEHFDLRLCPTYLQGWSHLKAFILPLTDLIRACYLLEEPFPRPISWRLFASASSSPMDLNSSSKSSGLLNRSSKSISSSSSSSIVSADADEEDDGDCTSDGEGASMVRARHQSWHFDLERPHAAPASRVTWWK